MKKISDTELKAIIYKTQNGQEVRMAGNALTCAMPTCAVPTCAMPTCAVPTCAMPTCAMPKISIKLRGMRARPFIRYSALRRDRLSGIKRLPAILSS